MNSLVAEIQCKARSCLENHLGNDTDGFIFDSVALLEKYAKLWQLSELVFMPTYTVNLLFSCDSALFGQCVLKICIPGPEAETEINCIRAYDGKGYVKLWNYNLADRVLLLERVTPGTQLRSVIDYKQRALQMAQSVKRLPYIICPQGRYPTYKAWMERLHKNLTNMPDTDDAIFYLSQALQIYGELKQTYNRNALLHGDMNQENLLLNHQGSYTIIDPKGVVDDPILETARFLMNEFLSEPEIALTMIPIMAPIIGVPESDMLKSMYIDCALNQCWSMEEHFPTQCAFDQNKHSVISICKSVYDLLNL